tara:strand:+ start:392 stop:514 length:123 start_codon:yes stop_codon:yes gene_type:complete
MITQTYKDLIHWDKEELIREVLILQRSIQVKEIIIKSLKK